MYQSDPVWEMEMEMANRKRKTIKIEQYFYCYRGIHLETIRQYSISTQSNMSDYGSESEEESVHSEEEKPLVKKGVPGAVSLRKEKKGDDSDVSSVATDDDEEANNLLSDADDVSDDEDAPEDEDAMFADERPAKKGKTAKTQQPPDEEDEFQFGFNSDDEDSEDDADDEEGNAYLQKLDESVREQTIANHHPELLVSNYEEVDALTAIVRDERGIIIDPLHRTLPFLTKYERTRILGERAKQINDGAKTFVETDPSVIDGYLIALAELQQKKIPFIIRRPLANGASEYWKLKDLEMI
jgi:DNA-directed RNA polymerase I, II, and III subunit RPABC2